MEDVEYRYHESGEKVDSGRHGEDFESAFGRYLFLQIICQRENFKNFRITREKKGTGKFDDILLVYDAVDDATKYRLFQLKHVSDGSNKIKYDDLIQSSKSYFGLPYYYDHYKESLKYLSNDKNLKHAKLEELVFCTNIDIGEDLGYISKTEVTNEGLLKNYGKLYKLSINNEGTIREIFHNQFLSERKRLANELAHYVMKNEEINIQTMISDNLYSFIKTFYEMTVEHVVNIETYEFKDSFMDVNLEHTNQELYLFRNEFFESLSEYHGKNEIQDTDKRKANKFKSSSFVNNETEDIIKFLKKKKLKIIGIPDINRILSEELILSMIFQKPIDIKSISHSPKSFHKLSKLIMEHVVDLDSRKLKQSFLSDASIRNEDLAKFRQTFLKFLKIFQKDCQDKNVSDLVKLFHIFNPASKNTNSEESFRMILADFKMGGEKMDSFFKNAPIRFKELPDDTEPSTDIFPSGSADTKEVHENIQKFLNMLRFAINEDDTHDVIFAQMQTLTTKQNDKATIYKGFNNFMTTWYNECISYVFFHESKRKSRKLKFRKWITEKELMENIENSTILFQNKVVKFTELCPVCEACSPELFLYTLTKGITLSLGNEIDQDDSFYINRVLNQKKISSDILKEQSQDIIIITLDERFNPKDLEKNFSLTVELKDLQSLDGSHRHFYTNEEFSVKIFNKFYNDNKMFISRRTVHWITYLGSDFKYESSLSDTIKSSGQQSEENEISNDSGLIGKFQANNLKTESELIKNQSIVITGPPGGGKSLLLKRLSYEVKMSNMFSWVIFISLFKYRKFFDTLENLENVDDITNFLAKVENLQTDFSRRILRHFLYNGRLILLFDGFDELHECSRQEKLLKLLQSLKSQSFSNRIFITTRPHYAKQIERALGVVSFELQDIEEDDQIKLVIELWKDEKFPFSSVEERAKEFVHYYNDDFSTTGNDFLGIPLQTYMFAIAYKDKALQSPSFVYDSVDPVQLFDDFISFKYDIFFREKTKIEKFLQKDNKSVNELRYQMFALKYNEIISHKFVDILSRNFVTKIPDEDIETLKKIGLIYETNNVCQFVHETFAEYYIAEFLLTVVENSKDENVIGIVKNVLKIKMKSFFNKNFFILNVFDAHLTSNCKDYEIQNSIMTGKEKFVIGLNKEELKTKVDQLGRGLFYYALQYEQFIILSHLIESDVELLFEPFFHICLKHFASDFIGNYKDEQTHKYEEIYIKLFEYILEKENEDGIFAMDFLDYYLDLLNEISLRHWRIAIKLISKFGKEVDRPSLYFDFILKAPKEFFSVFVKQMCKEEYLNWSNIINRLHSVEPDRLKEIIDQCNEFILRIPVCSGLLVYNFAYHNFYDCPNTNFSGYINSLTKSKESFNLLFKFLFESKDVSFEDFDKNFDGTNTFLLPGLPLFPNSKIMFIMEGLPFDLNKINSPICQLSSLKIIREDENFHEDLENILQEYMPILDYDEKTSVSDAAQKIVQYVLSKGPDKYVNEVYNKCISFETIEEASRYWEDAKRTELSKYFTLPVSTNNKD